MSTRDVPFATPQGASSSTFSPPPTDGSLTLIEMFDYNAIHNPKHPLLKYESPNDGSIQDILWRDAVLVFHRTARLVRDAMSGAETMSGTVIGILASLDALSFFNLIVGIMRAGYVPFAMSPRMPPAAVTNLLTKTGCKHLFVSGDATTQNLADAAAAQLQLDGHQVVCLKIPRFSDVFPASSGDMLPPLEPIDLDQPCIIMHSSGSSSLPKPITVTQRMVLPYGRGPYFGEVDWCGEILSAHGLPMFHMMGFLSIPWTAMTGVIAAFFPPSDPPPIPSPPAVLSACVTSKSTIMLVVPAFLEAWAKNPNSVQVLKTMKAVQVSGGPVQPDTGDFLAAHGVNLVVAFGMTEIGVATVIVPKKVRGEGWNWMRVSPHIDPAFLPVPEEENLFRLVFKKCSTHTPAVINTFIDGVDAFDSNDIVMRHPVDPSLFAVYGRDDDQITHSTGTNPIPIESILERDPKISRAVMFGRSKFQAGVLVMPSELNAFDPKDEAKVATFRNEIWETVSRANESAPRHSRIFKEMIIIAHAGKPFELTGKGTPRRKAILQAYATEIDNVYAAVDEISRSNFNLPQSWGLSSVMGFVRRIVRDVIESKLKDDDDIFSHGGDSLSATSIRSSIQLALRKSKRVPVSVIRDLPPHFVFDFRSIAAITAFLYGVLVASSSHVKPVSSDEDDDEIFDWQSMSGTATIIKLRKGRGETPLIIIHGVAGSVVHFKPFQEKFRSALWAIQITPDTPLTTLQEQAAFYYRKIKEEQPIGPYRLASFSASSFLLILITLLIEANGDQVIQAAMLDHFPTSIVPVIANLPKLDPTDPDCQRVFLERGLEVVDKQLRQDDGGLFPNQQEYADQIRDMSRGKSANAATTLRWERMRTTLLQMLDFMAAPATPGAPSLTVTEAMEALHGWMQRVKAPISVYVASKGMVECLPEDAREEWSDLGTRRCYPSATVVPVKGGHFGVLSDEELIKTLQHGFI